MRFSIDGGMCVRSEAESIHGPTIDHVYLCFFSDEEYEEASRFVSFVRAGISPEDQSTLSFPIPPELEEGVRYRALAFANVDSYVPEGYENYEAFIMSVIQDQGRNMSMDIFKKSMYLKCSGALTAEDTSFLPLHGELTHEDGFFFHKSGKGFEVSCDLVLSYSLCRVDIVNSAVEDIVINGVYPCNLRSVYSPFAPHPDSGPVISPDFSEGSFIAFPSADTGGHQSMTPAFFCFPNSSGSPSRNDATTTAVILSAFYRDPDTGALDSNPSFYRVNIIDDGLSQSLSAGFLYRLSISGVNARGKASPQQAFGEASPSIIVSSQDPNVSISGNVISIQAFHPEPQYFNSFISVPLQIAPDCDVLGISPADAAKLTFDISSDIQWPLEGFIGTKKADGLRYCDNSFMQGSVLTPDIPSGNETKGIPVNSTLFVSVGCMAPDDPDIVRKLILSTSFGEDTYTSEYEIRIYARPVIIDDVVLEIDGAHWLVCDRNVQISSHVSDLNPGYPLAAPVDHIKSQAYHYGSYKYQKIPSKFGPDNIIASETDLHPASVGYLFPRTLTSAEVDAVMEEWWRLYLDEDKCRSPFYTKADISLWTCPKTTQMTGKWPDKLACSKCRLFFVSDVMAADSIPICCYLPFHVYDLGANEIFSINLPNPASSFNNERSSPSRYMNSATFSNPDNSNNSNSVNVYFCSTGADFKSSTKAIGWTNAARSLKMIRLVRQLSDTELRDYKKNYLGCDGGTLRLKPCHKDTYSKWPESEKLNSSSN